MFKLDALISETIRGEALKAMPHEACGYLAGVDEYSAIGIYPLRNTDESSSHFTFDPAEQFAVVGKARESGTKLIAVYHSHPETPARMSAEDIRLLRDPDMTYFIYSVSEDELRAFHLSSAGNMNEIGLTILEEKTL